MSYLQQPPIYSISRQLITPHATNSEKELQSRCIQLDRWLGALTTSMNEPKLVPNAAKFAILKFLHMR